MTTFFLFGHQGKKLEVKMLAIPDQAASTKNFFCFEKYVSITVIPQQTGCEALF